MMLHPRKVKRVNPLSLLSLTYCPINHLSGVALRQREAFRRH
jgi:hypothetical protein